MIKPPPESLDELAWLTDLIKQKSKNISWSFYLVVDKWDYELDCIARTDTGGQDLRYDFKISGNEIENIADRTLLARYAVSAAARQFASFLFEVKE